jgi:hypothetical protein
MIWSSLICLAISIYKLYAKSKLLGDLQISKHALHISYMSKIMECINTKYVCIVLIYMCTQNISYQSLQHRVKTLILFIITKVTYVHYDTHIHA